MANSGRITGRDLRGRKFTERERKRAKVDFLRNFERVGVIGEACRATLVRGLPISRDVISQWQEHDPEFSVRFGQARAEADDAIRAEIRRRAIVGDKRSIYQGGRKVGTFRERSDTLLIFLAKSRMPEFRQKAEDGADAGVVDDGMRKLSVIDIMELAAQAATEQEPAANG